tara:strand:+ start:23 stop:283 length:261 start_codon:yes stop_codon:yes gene_type:complete
MENKNIPLLVAAQAVWEVESKLVGNLIPLTKLISEWKEVPDLREFFLEIKVLCEKEGIVSSPGHMLSDTIAHLHTFLNLYSQEHEQ